MWIKQGLIFSPVKNRDWLKSHAALPFAEDVEGNSCRVYFSGRDQRRRSHIGVFETNFENSPRRRPRPRLILAPGPLGAFDDSGVTNSWLVHHRGRKFLYYTGWHLGLTVPFYFYIGLAVSRDNGRTFQKVSNAPLLGPHSADPFLTASPCVLVEQGLWRMWYVSGVKWDMIDGKPRHYYHIKYAESKDGINWKRTGKVAIDFKSREEYAIARPCVLKTNGLYQMWYCCRGDSYRIGYAESKDAVHWERKDALAGIDVSAKGWDSQMLAYPFVFDRKGKRHMLYNGNNYGENGIGWATLGRL